MPSGHYRPSAWAAMFRLLHYCLSLSLSAIQSLYSMSVMYANVCCTDMGICCVGYAMFAEPGFFFWGGGGGELLGVAILRRRTARR